MDISADLDAPCPPATVRPWVDDLACYPRWLTIVPRAVPDAAVAADEGPAWAIHLRAKVGPLSRSKRLRMVRTRADDDEIVFERREVDGQEHSAWVLRARLVPNGNGCTLVMHLHYGGQLWESLVERLLRDEIEQSRVRLLALLAGG
jgi:hypothetical protein